MNWQFVDDVSCHEKPGEKAIGPVFKISPIRWDFKNGNMSGVLAVGDCLVLVVLLFPWLVVVFRRDAIISSTVAITVSGYYHCITVSQTLIYNWLICLYSHSYNLQIVESVANYTRVCTTQLLLVNVSAGVYIK